MRHNRNEKKGGLIIMIKNKYMFMGFLLFILTGGFFFSSSVSANNDGLPFYIEPIFPELQDEGITNYVSVSPQSDYKETLTFLITNKTDQKQEVSVNVLNAYTSSNGVIQYKTEETTYNLITDKKYEFNQYVDAPNSIELSGGESKYVYVNLDVPKVDGTLLGGISFKANNGEVVEKSENISLQIKNEVNSIYGVAIHFPTTSGVNFEVQSPFFDPLPSYFAVRLPVSFNSPIILDGVELEYEVFLEGEKLFFSKQDMKFAPMTKTSFTLPFEHNEIKAGETYTLKGKLSFEDAEGNITNELLEENMMFDKVEVFKDGDKNVVTFEQDMIYEDNSKSITTIAKKLIQPTVKDNSWLFLLLIPIFLIIAFLLLRKRKYILLSNDKDVPNAIHTEDLLYCQLKPVGRKIDTGTFRYGFYYKKVEKNLFVRDQKRFFEVKRVEPMGKASIKNDI